jgi:hypothetical protein
LHRGPVEEPPVAPEQGLIPCVFQENEASELHPGTDHLRQFAPILQAGFDASETRGRRRLSEQLDDLGRVALAQVEDDLADSNGGNHRQEGDDQADVL